MFGADFSLGRTIVAYRGHVNSNYNKMNWNHYALFSEQVASSAEVVEKHSSLVSMFEKLKRASAQWYHLAGQSDNK